MRPFLLITTILFHFIASGQIYNPVKWNFELKPLSNGEYLFVAKATIDEGWWVYSQHLESEDGPVATTVYFDEGPHYKLVGKNKESDNALKIFDKVFEMNVTKFKHDFTIEQKIKVIDASKPITGAVNFMTCNDERCLPPTDAEFSLKPKPASTGDARPASENVKSLTDVKSTSTPDPNQPAVKKKR